MRRQTYFGMLKLPDGSIRAQYILLTPEQAERTRATMEAETGARWLCLYRTTVRKRDRTFPTYTGMPVLA